MRSGQLVGALLGAVLAGAPAAASAAPAAAPDPEVEAIVAKADPAVMQVAWTTTDAAGTPRVHVEPVKDKAAARAVVARELDDQDTVAVSMDQVRKPLATNDSFRSQQWALDAFHAEAVYSLNQGNAPSQAIVAVVDSGVWASHPDLAGNVLPGIDVITDTVGTSTDHCGHGTHLAGIIAALANNARGVAGLAPRAKVLPVKFMDSACHGSVSDEAEGIYAAVAKGAQIINLSVGGAEDPNEDAAVQYALAHDVAVVAATGNDGCPASAGNSFPAAIYGVVGVAALGESLTPAGFSSCGSWVDVAAPGEGIVSTMIDGPASEVGCSPGVYYCFLSGTSMSAPYASAAIALAVSRCSLSGKDAVAAVLAKAHDVGPPGRDDATGNGIVDPLPVLQSGCSAGAGPQYEDLAGSGPYVRWYPNSDSGFTCDGKPVNVLGSEASETIVGTSGDDVILAGGGDDRILGGGGNDAVCAGAGNDYLRGQAGRDRLRGEAGADTMYGDAGADDLQAGAGDDRLVGGSDADYLEGGVGFDRVYYNDHPARVAVSVNNQANSGNGTDGPVGARDRLSFGVNSIIGGPGADTLAGSWGSDRLYGGGGDDKLYGNDGSDYVSGEAGADYLYGGRGRDSLMARDGVRDNRIDGGREGDSATIDRVDPTPISATARR
ncbi:MAG TPA: S8 family serine peptidase [Aeromicrobium sp.]|nr:S8 family serine peptidase [Aeromicrobium sp.]